MLLRKTASIAIALLTLTELAGDARANERHFTYTYESAVLPEDARELEVWTTWRAGRRRFYSALDHRIEYEVGLTSRLLTSFYVNASSTTEQGALGDRTTRFEARGISSEWKYKLLDSVADPIGLALYGELSASTDTAGVETKVIVDKRVGRFLFATNLVFEPEWTFGKSATTRELEVEADVAATFFARPNVGVGFELTSRSELGGRDSSLEWSALYAGPVLSYARESFWVAATFYRQLPAPVRDNTGGVYVLGAGESYNARLLFSFHI